MYQDLDKPFTAIVELDPWLTPNDIRSIFPESRDVMDFDRLTSPIPFNIGWHPRSFKNGQRVETHRNRVRWIRYSKMHNFLAEVIGEPPVVRVPSPSVLKHVISNLRYLNEEPVVEVTPDRYRPAAVV